MRLIDADALAKAIWAEKAVVNKQGNHTDHYFVGYNNGLNVARVVAIHAPTIDPEDLRPKGRWEFVDSGMEFHQEYEFVMIYRCSVCGNVSKRKGNRNPNYCPHCGADMRGDNRDTT